MSHFERLSSHRFQTLLLGICFFSFAVFLLLYSDSAKTGVSEGVLRCVEVLIPSLFPFMVLSSFCVKSGLSAAIGRVAAPAMKFLFHLPGSSAATIVMGMIGGYPVGAQGIRALLDEKSITPNQARQMLWFCVGAGPAFTISAVGEGMFGDRTIGLLLYLAQVATSLTMGIAVGWLQKKKENRAAFHHPSSPSAAESVKTPVANALVDSVSGVMAALIQMCAFVILFSALLSLLERLEIFSHLSSLFSHTGIPPRYGELLPSALLEVTAGAGRAAGQHAVFFAAFALGWSGLSVHFQIYAILSSLSFSKIKFMIARFTQGVLEAGFLFLSFLFLPEEAVQVWNQLPGQLTGGLHGSLPFLIAFLLMCAIFLFSLPFFNGNRQILNKNRSNP